MMEALIAARFGGWRGEGPAPAEPDYGRIAQVRERVAALAYPGTPYTATAMWLRPYDPQPHTFVREQQLLEEELAERIVNRRLEAHARGESAFISAGINSGSARNVADWTRMSVTARGDAWQPALQQSFAILRDALRAPPSAAEIEREIRVIRTSAEAAVTGEATMLSQSRAQQLINAIESRGVVATAPATLASFERMAPQMTPARIAAAMQRLVTGDGPRMMLVSPVEVAGGNAALGTALAAAETIAPAQRRADRQVSFDSLPSLGSPGREVSRQRIDDLDVTIVRFENGSTLTFKRTEYERGVVQVQLSFGEGLAGLAPDRPHLAWLGGIIGPSGIGDLDLDALERMMVGRRMAMNFAVSEDSFVLRGQTNAADLPDQLRLLAAKVAHPRWDPQLFGRYQANALESYDLAFASASARAGRELSGIVRPNDRRWGPIEREQLAGATLEQMRSFFTPLLAAGPVHSVIVGDVTLEQAIEAVRATVGALPRRPDTQVPAASRNVRPPAANPEPRRFTHQGDPSQAFAAIGWSTFGGEQNLRDRRALSLAANIFRVRMFDRLREVEGATYSPSVSSSSSSIFPDWGIFYGAAEVRPEHVPTFFRIAREIAADLAARPVLADEFARAQNPAISGITRNLTTNGYWMNAIEDFVRRPRSIEETRSYLADYRAMTPEDVRRAVAQHVTEQGDWSMVVLPARTAGGGQ
jgi:zinc protease